MCEGVLQSVPIRPQKLSRCMIRLGIERCIHGSLKLAVLVPGWAAWAKVVRDLAWRVGRGIFLFKNGILLFVVRSFVKTVTLGS